MQQEIQLHDILSFFKTNKKRLSILFVSCFITLTALIFVTGIGKTQYQLTQNIQLAYTRSAALDKKPVVNENTYLAYLLPRYYASNHIEGITASTLRYDDKIKIFDKQNQVITHFNPDNSIISISHRVHNSKNFDAKAINHLFTDSLLQIQAFEANYIKARKDSISKGLTIAENKYNDLRNSNKHLLSLISPSTQYKATALQNKNITMNVAQSSPVQELMLSNLANYAVKLSNLKSQLQQSIQLNKMQLQSIKKSHFSGEPYLNVSRPSKTGLLLCLAALLSAMFSCFIVFCGHGTKKE
jgi:hypothetical protein